MWCSATERLELHHRNPEDKEHHAIWSWKKERMENEIKKCDILCHDCHSTFHYEQMRTDPPHGISRYKGRHACRCDVCRMAVRDLERNRRLSVGKYNQQAKSSRVDDDKGE